MLLTNTDLKTATDLAALPDDGERYELIDGEILMALSPTSDHQDAVVFLTEKLNTIIRTLGLGKLYVAPFDVHATQHDVYQPDLLFVRKENLAIIQKDGVHGAPDFVIEILSPSNAYYDLKHKKDIYEQIGVQEYWIVDPMERSIECFINTGNGYEAAFSGKRAGSACSVVIPEFCVEVAEVFSL